MHSTRRAASSVLFTCLVLAGCSPTSLGNSGATTKRDPSRWSVGHGCPGREFGAVIVVGAGPQKAYTVQQQPTAGSCHYRHLKGSHWRTEVHAGRDLPAVTQANLKSTICRKGGYTSGIRPSTSVTGKEKKLNAASYGFTGRMSDVEYDHLISLQLGGDRTTTGTCWWSRPTPVTGRVPG